MSIDNRAVNIKRNGLPLLRTLWDIHLVSHVPTFIFESNNFKYAHSVKKEKNIIIWYSNRYGGLAQMVERALSMRELAGSMPASSTKHFRW